MRMRPPPPPPAVPLPAPPLAEMIPLPASVTGESERLPPAPPPLFNSPFSPLAERRPLTVSTLLVPVNCKRNAAPPAPPSGEALDPLPLPPPLPTEVGDVIKP